ncbi:hypothetical protein GXP67_04695 [Rhodocytophaga rosea]|uniref:Uncharacterized protein n=1 Tax=Rhodocytophaga rosea TaxID=2704465 RepID=A0A6C0GDD7_9BACT|nr:hypothetical protein [Rhodocytophaga rosea]QHT66019.1 hypothetical protein GXP67_04695 [Rhodocytophaga rosea]
MEKPLFIDNKPPENQGLNFEYLRSEGVKYIQQLCGAFWTDYNEHDPGVTILEVLCYALTDLSYRVDFDIQDHLYNSSKADQSFLRPSQILPSNALTINDYRRLVFDSILDVKNVWFIPVESEESSLRGLYKIVVNVDDQIKEEDRRQQVLHNVLEVYARNRNICEDVAEIKLLEYIYISIHADVEIDGTRDLESILAEIFFRVDEYLCPQIRIYSLEELLEQDYSLNEIFNGPLLKNGFIKTEDLLPKQNKILISEITKIMMQVRGVTSVKNLYLKIGEDTYHNQVDIDENKLPKLLTEFEGKSRNYTIQFSKGSVNYTLVDRQIVRRKLNELQSANRRIYRLTEEAIEVSKGKDLKIDEYYSIQNHFPVTYGIGSYGLPQSPSPQRRAQAKQLKGFLLLFEQILANYLSQLAHVKDILSIKSDVEQTYFHQNLYAVPDVSPLLANRPYEFIRDALFGAFHIPLEYRQGLSRLVQAQDNFINRRSRFLDYLLAIHGETFVQYSLSQFNYYFNEEEFERHLVRDKTRLLQFLPYINHNRAKASDYFNDSLSTENVAGMEAKLCVLLGLGMVNGKYTEQMIYEEHSLIGHFKGYGLKLLDEYASQTDSQLWEKAYSLHQSTIDPDQIDKSFDYIDLADVSSDTFTSEQKQDLLQKTLPFQSKMLTTDFLRKGIILHHYRIGAAKDGSSFQVVFNSGEEQEWMYIGQFETQDEATTGVLSLIDFLKELNISSEGLHLVEHILLRPEAQEKKFGFYVLDELGTPFLSTVSTYTFSQRKMMVEAFREHITTYANYSVEGRSDGDFEIHMKFPVPAWNEPLTMVSMKAYESVQEIHEKMERLYNFLSDKDDIIPFEDKLSLYVQYTKDTPQVPEDFYSYRISILLPDWTARFHNPEFKAIAEETIFNNQPANVSSRCFWLNTEDMKTFEKYYYRWNSAGIRSTANKTQLDKLNNDLTQLLLNLINKQ